MSVEVAADLRPASVFHLLWGKLGEATFQVTREGRGSGSSSPGGEQLREERRQGASARGLDTGWDSPPAAPRGLGLSEWARPGWCGAVGPEDNRQREKMALVRNWSDDYGLQMDYREEQSQEDAEEAEGSRGKNGEKVLERLRQSREGVNGRAQGQDFTARQEGKRQFPRHLGSPRLGWAPRSGSEAHVCRREATLSCRREGGPPHLPSNLAACSIRGQSTSIILTERV